jgi:putative peptide zinc metalloprotease protein
MTESLFNSQWHRVCELRPRLGPQIRVQRQRYRDRTWYVLRDSASGNHFRLNASAYHFVGRLDGSHSVNELWQLALEQLADQAPTQSDIIRLLAQLNQMRLVQYRSKPDVEALFDEAGEHRRSNQPRQVNPFAFRVPLFDPTPLLARLERTLPVLFHPGTLACWLAVTLAGALTAAVSWQPLAAHAGANLQSGRHLVLAWLCYPVMKALHELGHALAVRRWGGEVHEAGITLLFFTPAPYVDASAASAFRGSHQRALVSAAGIMVELFLASIALWIWLSVQPGLIRDIALVTLVIAAVSTFAVNGNPLLRFDGYYVLCDVLGLPNLAARSTSYWIYLLQRYVLGAAGQPPPPAARGEGKWLVLYAPLSFTYRVILACGILFWIGGKSGLLGFLVAIVMIILLLIKPARDFMKGLLAGGDRRRALAGCAVVAVGLFALPLPFTSSGQGVVWPPEDAQLRAEVEGFVYEVLAESGDEIEAGQVLIRLSDPALVSERDALASRMTGLRAEQYNSLLRNPVQAQDVLRRIERTTAELEYAEQRLDSLDVRSKSAGRLVLARPDDLPGSFVRKGTILGYVLTPGSVNVRALITGEDAPLVRERVRKVEVRLAERPEELLRAQIARDMPAATQTLPNAAFGERAGGAHRTDPSDSTGLRALEPVFHFDVAVAGHRLERVGGRAWVRFDLGHAPLAVQWYRRVSQLLLSHFNPTQ